MAEVHTRTSEHGTRPVSLGVHDQLLGDHALERGRQHDPDLLLLVGGEHVDDPVDGLGGVLGVQGGEDQVAGLGGGQRRGDGLEVPQLTDQDHVGVLAQHPAQGLGERVGVLTDLPLVMIDRLWSWRNSMGSSTVTMCSGLVRLMMSISDASVVDLPEPVGPVTSTRPFRRSVKALTAVGNAQRVELRHLVGDGPQGGGDRPPLQRHVDPEPSHAGDGVRGVQLVLLLEPLALGCRQDPEHHVPDLSLSSTGHPSMGRMAPCSRMAPGMRGRQVEVRRADGHRVAQQVVDVQRHVPSWPRQGSPTGGGARHRELLRRGLRVGCQVDQRRLRSGWGHHARPRHRVRGARR
jgi:hypothetical protein